MVGEQANYQNYVPDSGTKIRDLEEKQRMMKNQLLLIGRNLIDLREKVNEETLGMKKDIQELKEELSRISSIISTISDESAEFARKDDLEILSKQMKMFQPFGRPK